jgi:hypothetical protein
MLIRLGVALVILIPYMLFVGQGQPIWLTLIVAFVAFGAGRLAQNMAEAKQDPPKS